MDLIGAASINLVVVMATGDHLVFWVVSKINKTNKSTFWGTADALFHYIEKSIPHNIFFCQVGLE